MSTPYGLTAARTPGEINQYVCATAGLAEGAIVIWDTSVIKGKVKAPTGAAITGIAGVLVDVLGSGTTVAGGTYNFQRTGTVPVLVTISAAITVGDKVIIGDTSGGCKPLGTNDSCDILGVAKQTLTGGAAATDLIMVDLQIQFTGDTVP